MANIDPFGTPLMTEEEFERAIAGRRFSEDNLSAARRVLVDGQKVATVANELGISRQPIHRVSDAIYQHHLEIERIPADWIRATVAGPADEIQKFKQRMEKLRRERRLRGG